MEFRSGVNVGVDYPVDKLRREFDSICLAGGATQARELDIPGRELKGVHLAMDYLTRQNKLNAGEHLDLDETLTAAGKRVVILGGGDTGADCLGTAHRQGAEVVHQFELLPEPPETRSSDNPWPQWPTILRSSAAHEEGGIRDYNILTKRFSGKNGQVGRLHAVRLEWGSRDATGRATMNEIAGSEFEVETELVLLAMGFVHTEHPGMLTDLGVELDGRGNVKIDRNRMSSVPGIFAAGTWPEGNPW